MSTILLDETGKLMKRLHAVGQSIIVDFKAYEVLRSDWDGKDERLTTGPCEICQRCGGIVGSSSEMEGCCCGTI